MEIASGDRIPRSANVLHAESFPPLIPPSHTMKTEKYCGRCLSFSVYIDFFHRMNSKSSILSSGGATSETSSILTSGGASSETTAFAVYE